jgi:Uma2 family endonuclease
MHKFAENPEMEFSDLDINKSYTYADYLQWTFKERVELIKGKLFKMSPAPNRMHQGLSLYLSNVLYNYLKASKCKVYTAPFDVRLPRKTTKDKDVTTVLQPDICVICDESKLDYQGCIGAPDIVVEILSPGNNAIELKNKYEVYEQAGVTEYWVVSPQDKTFLVYTLKEGKYQPSRLMVAGDIITSTVLDGFSIDLTDLFESIN